jgi:hypothetical protein
LLEWVQLSTLRVEVDDQSFIKTVTSRKSEQTNERMQKEEEKRVQQEVRIYLNSGDIGANPIEYRERTHQSYHSLTTMMASKYRLGRFKVVFYFKFSDENQDINARKTR